MKVLTKASASPLLSGLATGVKQGCKPKAVAKRTSAAAFRQTTGRPLTVTHPSGGLNGIGV